MCVKCLLKVVVLAGLGMPKFHYTQTPGQEFCVYDLPLQHVLLSDWLFNVKRFWSDQWQMWLCVCVTTTPTVDEWKNNLMSLAILFHLLCTQHVSDINISIFRSLRLCWWITTSVVLFSVRCVLELLLRLVFGGVCFAGWSTTYLSPMNNTTYKPSTERGISRLCFSLQNEHHQIPASTKAPTHNELRTRRPMW